MQVAGEQRAREVLVDHGLDADELPPGGGGLVRVRHRDAAAARADHHALVFEQPFDRLDPEDATRLRRGDDAAEAVAVGLELPALLLRELRRVRLACRSARSASSGRRRRGRRGRPRSWSGGRRGACRTAARSRAPAGGCSRSSRRSGRRAGRADTARPRCRPSPAARAARPAGRSRARSRARARARAARAPCTRRGHWPAGSRP